MNLSTILIPFFSVIGAWLLTRITDRLTDHKQVRKKHNKLLFHLLELQSRINRVLELEKSLEQALPTIEKMLSEEFKQEVSLAEIKPFYMESLQQQFEQQLVLPGLPDEIDESLRDLAETDPVLSFRLLGNYQLTQKMQMIRDIMENMRRQLQLPEVPWDQLFLQPVMTDLARDLEQTIAEVAGRCSKTTRKQLLDLKKSKSQKEPPGFKEFMEQLIKNAKKMDQKNKQ